jgi:hypothetical protein
MRTNKWGQSKNSKTNLFTLTAIISIYLSVAVGCQNRSISPHWASAGTSNSGVFGELHSKHVAQ